MSTFRDGLRPLVSTVKSRMKPSSLRTLAIAILILEVGIDTESCFAVTALLSRVSMSAIGSVISRTSELPARLRDAWDLALERQLAEADPAHREHTHEAARPAAEPAAVLL